MAEKKGCDLDGLTLAEMQSIEPLITDDVFNVLSVDKSVASRVSFGGTAPTEVLKQVEIARKRIG
jgi:argininosuccinate lyase